MDSSKTSLSQIAVHLYPLINSGRILNYIEKKLIMYRTES